MAVVQMPDGARVRFPDEMPPDQVRALIRQKFPQDVWQHEAASRSSSRPWEKDPIVRPAGQPAPPWEKDPIVRPAAADKTRRVEFEGQIHEFPGDFTDAEIAKALDSVLTAPKAKKMRRVEFEGQIHEFPGDFTDEEIAKALDSMPSAAQPDAPAEPDPWAAFPKAPPELSQGSPSTASMTLDNPMVAEQPAPPRPFAPQHIGRDLQLGTQDVGRGVANLAGAPFDITNSLLNLILTGADKVANVVGGKVDYRLPVGASKTITDTFSDLANEAGAPPIPWEDRTGSEKVIGNVIDFATQGGGGALGLAKAAAVRAPQIAAGTTKTVADAFMRPYLENAGRTLAGDIASGAGAGVGVNAADTYFPDSPIAHALATMIGGVGGSTLAELAQSAARTVADVSRPITFRTYDPNVKIDPLTNTPSKRTDVETAARMMQELTRDPLTGVSRAPAAARTIAERTAEFQGNDLPVPTTGVLSDNAGLIAAEAAARGRDNLPFVERDARIKSAAAERASAIRDPEADRGAVLTRANEYRNEVLGPGKADFEAARLRDEGAATARAAEGAPLSLARDSESRANASRSLDKAIVEDTYLPDRRAKNELYEAIDPEGTALRDTTPLADAVAQLREAEAALPPSMQTHSPILSDIEGLVDPATGQAKQIAFRDLETMRMKLSRAAREAREGSSPNFDLADAYDAVRRAIAQDAKRMAEEGGPAGERAAAAHTNYRDNFAPKYRVGPGDEMTTFTRRIDQDPSRSTTPPSETAGRFLKAPEKAAALKRVIESSPSREQADAAVHDYLLSDFAASVLNPDGTVNARRAHLWADNNRAVLEQFPKMRSAFDSLVTRARSGEETVASTKAALKAAIDRGALTERDIGRSVTGTLLREDPRDVARSIFSESAGYSAAKRLDEINDVLGNDEAARRGWKAAVAEVITDRVSHLTKLDEGARASPGESFRVELGKLESVFQRHEAALAKVFTPQEMNTLRQAHALLEPLRNAAARAAGLKDGIDKYAQIWRLAEIGLKAKFGVLKGGGVLRTLRVVASALPSNADNVQRLIQRAFFDPELAQYLLTKKVRNLDYEASNKYIRRLMVGAELARESGREESPE